MSEDVRWVGEAQNTWKNLWLCDLGYLWIWSKQLDLKCTLDVSWQCLHLYFCTELSTCHRLTQDRWWYQVWAVPLRFKFRIVLLKRRTENRSEQEADLKEKKMSGELALLQSTSAMNCLWQPGGGLTLTLTSVLIDWVTSGCLSAQQFKLLFFRKLLFISSNFRKQSGLVLELISQSSGAVWQLPTRLQAS